MSRTSELIDFYALLERLERALGGTRMLGTCTGRSGWPARGVYFFFEAGERRSNSGNGLRLVRVGTHALRAGEKSELWERLKAHQGVQSSGAGNHRGSVFRDLVGAALASRDPALAVPSWPARPADEVARAAENALECRVSTVIRAMPFLWVAVDNDPGSDSQRASIERNAIALLSNYQRNPLDPPSHSWLGHHCNRERVRSSGLWNSNGVDHTHERGFLAAFETLIAAMERA
jgi:hypothetical protein